MQVLKKRSDSKVSPNPPAGSILKNLKKGFGLDVFLPGHGFVKRIHYQKEVA